MGVPEASIKGVMPYKLHVKDVTTIEWQRVRNVLGSTDDFLRAEAWLSLPVFYGIATGADVPGKRDLAIATDHSAMVSRQRRWFSLKGGFSGSYHLNQAYREAYRDGWDVPKTADPKTADPKTADPEDCRKYNNELEGVKGIRRHRGR